MAERKYDIRIVILALFVTLLPTFGAAGDKAAVIYSSLFVSLFVTGITIYKEERLLITKTCLLLSFVGVVSLLQLFYVSDKGSQVELAAIFITSALLSSVVKSIKEKLSPSDFMEGCTGLLYVSALLYALIVFLHQAFVENNILFGKMNFTAQSETATGVMMLAGVFAALRLFYGKKKSIIFYPSVIFMCIVFLLTGSLTAYLLGAVLVFVTLTAVKRKKIERFIAFAAVVILGAGCVISGFVSTLLGKIEPEGAFRGIVKLFGIGSGGYNATTAILGDAYSVKPPVYMYFCEVFGVAGLVLTGIMLIGAYKICVRKNSLGRIFVFSAIVAMVVSTAEAMCFTLPLFAMMCALCEEEKELRVKGIAGALVVLPMAFCTIFVFGQIAGAFGSHLYDFENYEMSAKLYEFSANCRIFDSASYEKAYDAYLMKYEHTGQGIEECEKNLVKAHSFNKKNYLYKAYLSDLYELKGEKLQAVGLWEEIIRRYDREILYVQYARKIASAMSDDIGLEKTKELYDELLEYATRAEDEDVKFEVNNIVSEAQKYYIEKREGKSEIYYREEIVPPEEAYTDAEESVTEGI